MAVCQLAQPTGCTEALRGPEGRLRRQRRGYISGRVRLVVPALVGGPGGEWLCGFCMHGWSSASQRPIPPSQPLALTNGGGGRLSADSTLGDGEGKDALGRNGL